MRGRKPLPREVRIAQGNRGKRPIPDEHKVVRIMPERPAGMTPTQRRYWDDYAPRTFRLGTLTEDDADALMRLCQLLELRDRLAKAHRRKIPESTDLRLYLQLTKEIRAHEELFGLNAMARTRIPPRDGGRNPDEDAEDDLD